MARGRLEEVVGEEPLGVAGVDEAAEGDDEQTEACSAELTGPVSVSKLDRALIGSCTMAFLVLRRRRSLH